MEERLEKSGRFDGRNDEVLMSSCLIVRTET